MYQEVSNNISEMLSESPKYIASWSMLDINKAFEIGYIFIGSINSKCFKSEAFLQFGSYCPFVYNG